MKSTIMLLSIPITGKTSPLMGVVLLLFALAILVFLIRDIVTRQRRYALLFNMYIELVEKWLASGSKDDAAAVFKAFEDLKEDCDWNFGSLTVRDLTRAYEEINSQSENGYVLETRNIYIPPFRKGKE